MTDMYNADELVPAPCLVHPNFENPYLAAQHDPQGSAYIWWMSLHNRHIAEYRDELEEITLPDGELTDFERVAAELSGYSLHFGGTCFGTPDDPDIKWVPLTHHNKPNPPWQRTLLELVYQPDAPVCKWQARAVVTYIDRFLTVTEAAEFLGISPVAFRKRSPQPVPDVWIGNTRGFSKATLLDWQKRQPPRRGPRSTKQDKDTDTDTE